jgi:hypothetical protein
MLITGTININITERAFCQQSINVFHIILKINTESFLTDCLNE